MVMLLMLSTLHASSLLSQTTTHVSLWTHFTDKAKSTELRTGEPGLHLALSKYWSIEMVAQNSYFPVAHILKGKTGKGAHAIWRDEG